MAKGGLWLHGDKWYLKLSIPPSVRKFFLSKTGKPLDKIVEPLAGDKAIAKVLAAQRVAECTSVFAQCKAGIITTPEQAKDALQGGYSEPDIALQPGFDAAMRRFYAELASKGPTQGMIERALERQATAFEAYGRSGEHYRGGPFEQPATRPAPAGETVSQAAEAWFAELTRDKTAAPRQSTVDGHRLRVRVFVDKCGDLPLTEVTRAMASDFLAGLDVSNRTRNIYMSSLRAVFDSARKRGRFTGENPFAGQRSKVVKNHKVRYTVDELRAIFDALPREVKPKKHTPYTAVPWVALISAYSGACLEEICQLTVDDVREESVNGGRLWCIDIHNGDDEHKLKNERARPRLLPMHSALVRAGLLDYIANLPDERGQLFPGLARRASKDHKLGPRVGEIYNKKLGALGIKRKGLDFHSFRHTVSNTLEIAGVPQTDAARVLGHSIEGMSYGTYSQAGPGLKRVAGVVEQIEYEGLRL
jgi:integrase